MTTPTAPTHRVSLLLKIGRVSNLPTVWTNVVAGAFLAGLQADLPQLLWVMLAITLFYTGGMYLNDAFDADIDARERPSRPIPSGQISAKTVSAMGCAMLMAGIFIVAPYGVLAVQAGVALSLTILLYNAWHKGNVWSPVIMGSCRALVYLLAAWSFSEHTPESLWWGMLAVFTHIAGLTYAAKQESLDRIDRLWPLAILAAPLLVFAVLFQPPALAWVALVLLAVADVYAVRLLALRRQGGDVPRAVAQLIAACALLDAVAVAVMGGSWPWVAACIVAYVLCRLFQRFIPGT
jgi:UbiA prenyltransferase family